MRPNDDKTIKLWPVLIVAIILVFGLLTFQRVVRLDTQAPPDFASVAATAGVPANPALAQGYWNIAVNVIQWRYARGVALPESPPTDFVLPPDSVKGQDSPAVRAAYWNALRRVWLRPAVWHNTIEVDFGWPAKAIRAVIHDIDSLTH